MWLAHENFALGMRIGTHICRSFGGNSRTGKVKGQAQHTMWIQVRSMDGRRSVRVDNLSKLTHIEELRERLVEHFQAEPERQRLFYRGKQVWV